MITLLYIHSILRWVVALSLLSSVVVAFMGYRKNLKFSAKINLLRHWTATFAHIQLMFGMFLAFKSPYFNYFWKNTAVTWSNTEAVFYGLFHPLMMFLAIIILTVGSAKSKRRQKDSAKFKTMLVWFTVAAILIFMAIPWPFSPFSTRPLIPIY